MKKIIYSAAFLVATTLSVQAQTPIKETREEMADVALVSNDLLIYTKKEKEGQFLYTEQKGAPETARKEAQLNAGTVNTLVGYNPETDEIYVYHRRGRRDEVIAFYTYSAGVFTKSGERKLPRLRNNSFNLGLFLAPEKNELLIAAELGRTKGYDDIYLSTWENNRWSKPKNLGAWVNTRQPEFAPFIANDSLYFSRQVGEAAYVYGVPYKSRQEVTQEPAKLTDEVNQEQAFNASYKRRGEQELWITTGNNGKLTAYTTGLIGNKEEAVTSDTSQAKTAVASQPAEPEKIAEVKAEIRRAADLQLPYSFNSLYLSNAAVKELCSFLEKQPKGAQLHITGYSDGKGPDIAKQDVSRRRATYVVWYIKQNLAHKDFVITREHAVAHDEGAAHRKVEIRVN